MLRIWIAGLLLLVGCPGDAEPEEEPVCEPGRVASCPCGSGEGSQSCKKDGSAWGECLCPGEQAAAGAGAGAEAPNLNPEQECAGRQNPDSLHPGDRCDEPRSAVYSACSKEIMAAGICEPQVNLVFYCCPGED